MLKLATKSSPKKWFNVNYFLPTFEGLTIGWISKKSKQSAKVSPYKDFMGFLTIVNE